jgi:hypothetical protein
MYALAGPTDSGAVNLRARAEAGEALSNRYHVTMTVPARERFAPP